MRSLYEIDNDILSCVDTETGEIVDEAKLEALEMERDKKIEAVILWRKDLLAEAKAVKEEAQNLSKRVKSCENKAEQLKSYISKALDGAKFKTDRCSVSYRKTESIVIDDLHQHPVDVWKELSEDWISKTKIKEMFEAGEEVKGAHQEEKQSIIIK
jgi:hypothetical protein